MTLVIRALFAVAVAAGLAFGSPVSAQSRNPIQAAKDAFKKAREEQEAKKPPQPTAAPATPAPSSPATAGAATAECCSPDAIAKLAASVGFVDIVGVKLGITLEQAVAALKAANPRLVIDVHDVEIEAGGKLIRRPLVILAHLSAGGRNPSLWGNPDGSHEAIGVQLTTPPGPMVVDMVVRFVSFPSSSPVAASTLLEAHRKKYGPESFDDSGAALGWVYDLTGKLLQNPGQAQINCLQQRPQIVLEIRGEDASNQPGKTINGLQHSTFTQDIATRCVPYVVARAEIQHKSPSQLEAAFWTTIHSPGLKRNSLALTQAFIKQSNENLIKEQENAGAKRAAPKL
jgi:hypothetical protein